MQGNILAYLMLLGWPVIVLATFASRRGKAPMVRTAAWLFFLGVMILPSNLWVDAPLIPPMNKERMNNLSVWLGLIIFHRREILQRAPLMSMPRLILLALVIGGFMTVRTNQEPLVYGPLVIPGLTPYDVLSNTIASALDFYLPFAIGQRVFRSEADLKVLFEVAFAGLVLYAPFMIFELRFSPQLHNYVYGYFPSDFIQSMRGGGGFRPVVLMQHGLNCALFTFECASAGAGLTYAKIRTKPFRGGGLFAFGIVMIAACKSLAPFLFTMLTWIFARLKGPGALRVVILLVCAVALSYPVTRSEGTFPTQAFLDFAGGASAERRQSLEFRFENEDKLLARAMEKPTYGWGSYGRNRVYDEYGIDRSVTDGAWILFIGYGGYVGFFTWMAVYSLPLLRAAWNIGRVRGSARALLATLTLICTCVLVNIIPNANPDSLPILYLGALWTLSETLARKRPVTRRKPAPVKQTAPAPSLEPAQA